MRPAVLVTRATLPDIAGCLRKHFEADDSPTDSGLVPVIVAAVLTSIERGSIADDAAPAAALT